MFSYTVHLPTVFLFLESLAFVKLFLTSGKGDIHLGSTVLVDENQNRDDGKTHILGSGLEMTYLALLEQKFAVTLSLVIGKRAIEIRADVHTLDPYFPTVYHTVAIDKRSLAGTYRLNLRTGEYHACRIGINEEILKRGFLVAYLHRALLA